MPNCSDDKIINPATGRCVKKTGKIGKALLQDPVKVVKEVKVVKVVKEVKDKSCSKAIGLLQKMDQGTCWFNANVNMLALGEGSRALISSLYDQMTEEEKLDIARVRFYKGVCPMPNKTVAMRLLMDIIAKKPKRASTMDPLKYAVRFNVRETPNWDLERRQHTFYVDISMPRFLKHLLPVNEFSWERAPIARGPRQSDKIYMLAGAGRQSLDRIKKNPLLSGFFLDSVAIRIQWKTGGGHFVCGYMCGGKPYVYDSLEKNAIRCDWTKHNELETSMKATHPHGSNIVSCKYSLLLFANKPLL